MDRKKPVLGTLATTLTVSMLSAGLFALPNSATPAWAVEAAPPVAAAAPAPAAPAEATEPYTPWVWTLDPTTAKGGEQLQDVDGWTYFKASSRNGNDPNKPASYPAVAVKDGTYDFTKPGEFTATIASPQEGAKNRFGFYLGYKNPGHGLFIGFDKDGWFWQRYGADGQWYSDSRVAAPEANVDTQVKITWTGSVATLTVDGQKAFDVDYSAYAGDKALTDKLAMKASGWGSELTQMFVRDPKAPIPTYAVTGSVVSAQNEPLSGATVSTDGHSATTETDGTFRLEGLESGEYTLNVSKAGYEDETVSVTVSGADAKAGAITLSPQADVQTETLSTPDMDVAVKTNFPSVYQYTMKKLDGRVLYGQTKDVRTVNINGTDVQLADGDVKFTKVSETKATYELTVQNAAKHVDAVVTVDLGVEANKLHLNVTKIENKLGDEQYPVQTLSFPNHSIISMRSSQEGAQFTGAVISSDTNKVGDTNFAIERGMKALPESKSDFMYAFLSGGQLSASMWSNSEHEGRVVAAPVRGGSHNTRILTTLQTVKGEASLGLASAPWYYHRVVTDSKGKSYTVPETEMPKMSVVITGDANEDKTVNWQDGALAFREIMNNPYKSEEVPELVAWRIAMNFGSQAQNPFLTTLDNVKKVALHTDGLGQSVLLKGYGSEGHDSGHPDYGDIGTRIGGAKDFNTLMTEGSKLGARFGVHVNASEMYPEAKAFSEDTVRRNASGGLSYGWNWLDQGVGIDGIYDLATGARVKRFADLKKQVGENMDFIYLDVWGNLTSSGSEDSWETRKMSKMINENGWRMTTEWGSGNEYDSTFQHWAADLTYGGSTSKGENSQVIRFLRNHQKDSWVGDYPSYGGAANAPLLGGYNMKDFEGWQGRNDYDAYIRNLFTHDVSTKFLQHFKVVRWVNNPLDPTSVQDPSTNGGNEQIVLKDAAGNEVTVSRESNSSSTAAYRNRTITLNGRVIASGAVSRGDNGANGTESYLLPWLWDAQTGQRVGASDEKLYHWNTTGGSSTWQLPAGWENLASVKIYKLTDLGKTEEKVVPVSGGQVTLTADAQTPYVVYKGEASPRQLSVVWSQGMHLVDAGFNGGEESLRKNWAISAENGASASVQKSQHSNPMLKLTGEVRAQQKLTDLTAGKRYALYVGVDNRSLADARMTVTAADGTVLATNSSGRSVARNFVKAYSHNTNSSTVGGSSYFQNMYVFFTAPASGDVTLTLSHEGAGDVYFDDVRVVENDFDGLKTDARGYVTSFTNNFEKNVQGIWPFVISGAEGVEDNRIHLSEKHAPYTQAGWDVKKMDDVLEGTWSVKVNGVAGGNTLVYQTIPQNLKFEAGRKYRVSFDYQSGTDNIYAVALGAGEYSPSSVQLTNLPMALGMTRHYEFEFTGGVNDDSWFGIASTSAQPDTQGTRNAAASFGGYKDFVLDNLKVERVSDASGAEPGAEPGANAGHTLKDAQAKIAEVAALYDGRRADFADEAWSSYTHAMAMARTLVNKNGATADDAEHAYGLMVALAEYMSTAPGNEASDKYDVSGEDVRAGTAGSSQPNYGDIEGPADFAQDSDPGTYWHTAWGENALRLGKAWYRIDFTKPTTVNGVRYLPRPGAANANGKLKKVKVEVITEDSAVQVVAEAAELSTNTVWQKISFPAVEGARSVKITALETAGQTASQANTFASAAELRATTPLDADAGAAAEPTEADVAHMSAAKKNLAMWLGAIAEVEEGHVPDGLSASAVAALKARVAAAAAAAREASAKAEAGTASEYEVALAAANLESAWRALAVNGAGTSAEALPEGVPTEKGDPAMAEELLEGQPPAVEVPTTPQQKPRKGEKDSKRGKLAATGVTVKGIASVVLLCLAGGAAAFLQMRKRQAGDSANDSQAAEK
ncbi:serine protease [Alloscardovia macacae]|uniref:Serine protease n=1 Tax=Alloscardovia macacae TaxID=1160091 RepID=A0A1Y2STP9_9BIFI|nr:DUF2012 domain-containing protein [Alloscardovia macacae]OTA26042.1 serine protease [Alloscardovia macacae]OTA29900.1 serine protease [Alloscardovia macacae]